jgi:AcrR family transcriptional regulator
MTARDRSSASRGSGKPAKRAAVEGALRRPSDRRHVGLTEATLLDAALEVVRRVGIDNLTMRRFADELGVTQMAAYYHLKNKRELLERVADDILSQIPDTSQLHGTWEDRLRHLALETIEELSKWPGVASLLMRLDPQLPHSIRLIDNAVATLVEAGFTEDEARMAGSMVSTWSLGIVAWRDGRSPGADHPFYPSSDGDATTTNEFVNFALTAMIEGLRQMLGDRSRPRRRA